MKKLKIIYLRFRLILEDYFFTAPHFFYTPKFQINDKDISQKLLQLKLNGYTSLGKIFDKKQVLAIKKCIDNAVQSNKANSSKSLQYWTIHNPLKLHKLVFDTSMNLKCISLAEKYFKRNVYLADIDIRRIMPAKMESIQALGYSSSNWHRDTRGRQLKMMIYLSDVKKEDSNFSFVPGTHLRSFARKMLFMESRLSNKEVKAIGIDPIEWTGEAGDAMLFDTNIIHRLRRKSKAAIRDSVTYYYTPGQNLRCLKYYKKNLHKNKTASRIFNEPFWPFKRD
jgi:hypothetical protein